MSRDAHRQALGLLAELESLVKATRLCLQGPRPSFPVYTADIQRIGLELVALAVRDEERSLLEVLKEIRSGLARDGATIDAEEWIRELDS